MEQYENGPAPEERAPEKSNHRIVVFLLVFLVCVIGAAGVFVYSRMRAEKERLAREADPFIEPGGVFDLRTADLGDGSRLFTLEAPVLSIDLTGQEISPETYDKLARTYPEAAIRWTVPVGSARFDCKVETVTLPDAEEATLASLSYLKNLKLVDGTAVDDTETLAALQREHPEWTVRYAVNLFGHEVLSTDKWLPLNDIGACDTDVLLAALEMLPAVTDIDLVGVEMTNGQKALLRSARPDIRWYWLVDIAGTQFRSTDQRLDFTRTDFDSFDAFLEAVCCFNTPLYVDVSTQGFPNVLMERAVARFPETTFAWVLRIGKYFIRTDVTVLDLGYEKGERSLKNGDIDDLKYLRNLEALSLDNQSLSDLSPLAGLTNLKILCLGSNRLEDLSRLSALTNLEYLNLSNNKITDITPLAGLTKLTDLNLSENDVTSLGLLSGITSLKRVCAAKNPSLQVGDQVSISERMPGTAFDFSSTRAWQNDAVYDTVDTIFTARQMTPLRDGQ